MSRREAIGVFRKHANAIRDKVKIINALRGPVKGGPKVSGLAAPGGFLAAVKAQKAKEDAAEAAAAGTKSTPVGTESTPDDKALRKARRVSVKKDAADAAKIAAAVRQLRPQFWFISHVVSPPRGSSCTMHWLGRSAAWLTPPSSPLVVFIGHAGCRSRCGRCG